MAELLLELLSEEIPARMQQTAADQLRDHVSKALVDASLPPRSIEAHATPRRLTLLIEGLPDAQPDTTTERKGPRVDAPEKAVQGFLRSIGKTLDDVEERELPKGRFYFVVLHEVGQATADVLPDLLADAIGKLGWPKSMRWGAFDMRWVRPLHSVVCLLDGQVLPLTVGHLEAGDTTRGHRFLSPDPFPVASIADYRARLANAHVVLDRAERRRLIVEQAEALARAKNLQLRPDDALIDEVAGLVEHPVAMLGTIDPDLMDLPPEVLVLTLRNHQKYFNLVDGNGELAPYFVVVANLPDPGDGAIAHGNERVLRARLKDAQFFFQEDRKTPLATFAGRLGGVVFNARLGEGADRVQHKVERMVALAPWLAAHTGADAGASGRAALLAKADLVTEMVGEFPELQGTVGAYYARFDDEPEAVAEAVEGHYAPRGRADDVPTTPVSVTVGLADRLDTLVAFFAIGERPTGSKDPFGLRRTALGVLRVLLANQTRLPLRHAIAQAHAGFPEALRTKTDPTELTDGLLGFLLDRLKVLLRERDIRHDLITAVLAARGDDDLVRITDRVEALRDFLQGDDGQNLLAAYRRACNIVAIEEKKDGTTYDGDVDPARFTEAAENALHTALAEAGPVIRQQLDDEAYALAMGTLATLRGPVDAFLENVLVNADDAEVRANRLRQLARIRASLEEVADLGRIEDK